MTDNSKQPQRTRPPKTPCIGICSTTSFGDLVCRGCKRYNFEVISWNAYSHDEKQAVLRRLEQLEVQILQNKLKVVSEQQLERGLRQMAIPYDPSLSPLCWVHNLLKLAHRQVGRLSELGIEVSPEFAQLSPSELGELVENELSLLCEAHHERYMAGTN